MVKRLRSQLVASRSSPSGYGCAFCSAHLCLEADILSRHFQGKHGRAFLVDRCENCYFGPQEMKELMTGTHIVRDVFCSGCDKYVGWGYDFAHVDKERYKVHRFVLERKLIRTIRPGANEGCLALSDRPAEQPFVEAIQNMI